MTGPDTVNSEMFSCDAARRRTLLYQAGLLPMDEMELMRRHNAECPECAEATPAVASLRNSIKSAAVPQLPADLRVRLRVDASHAAAERRQSLTLGDIFRTWAADFKLWTNNLMKPLALPTAGGFLSSMILFGVVASGIGPLYRSSQMDVPTGLYTEASVKSYLPLGFQKGDIVLELTIDDQGRVVDYSLPSLGTPVPRELRKNIENHLLFTQFNPATSFGQPISGKVRIWFRSSQIDVKG